MPIRFPCPHCQQKLSISSRKAGASANCPRCHKELTVPADEKHGASPVAATDSPAVQEEAEHEDPYSQFAVFDETELVYDAPPKKAAAATLELPLQQRISIPRYVLLTQGVLLGVVALVSFTLGLMAGGTFSSQTTAGAGAAVKISGTISYAAGARTLPDAGAVVIFLPQTKDPGRRITTQGLRPEDPLPDAPLASAEELRNMGGAYARADDQGRFEVQLADPGTYYVLVLSGNSRRRNGEDIHTPDLVKISRFIDNASELLADSRYQFSTETLRGNRQFSARFE